MWFGLCRRSDIAEPDSQPSEKPTGVGVPEVKVSAAAPEMSAGECSSFFNLRDNGLLPSGRCIYIQSGDTSDFDGYYIAAAGQVVQRSTEDFEYVIAVPERRAWPDVEEPDTMKHDPESGEQVMTVSGALLRNLCPEANLVRGALNSRNIIPWKWMFNEPAKYGPLVSDRPPVEVGWKSLEDLAEDIKSDATTSVVLDMNGSMGYLEHLVEILGPDGRAALGRKMKAAGIPFIIMAGVMAEVATLTLPLPGRDPRATKNAIYYPAAVRVLLDLARDFEVPLVFVTNNTCNALLKFEDAAEVEEKMGLQGLLKQVSDVWFSMPHLKGKCVPFDWMAFVVMLLVGRKDSALKIAQQELWVGKDDPSVLVLRNPAPPLVATVSWAHKQEQEQQAETPSVHWQIMPSAGEPSSEIVEANLKNTEMWGMVGSVLDISREDLLALAKYASAQAATWSP